MREPPPTPTASPPTLHLDKVQLVDRLQEGSAVQGEVKVARHPRGERSLPPLALCHVDPPDQSIRDLGNKFTIRGLTHQTRSQMFPDVRFHIELHLVLFGLKEIWSCH